MIGATVKAFVFMRLAESMRDTGKMTSAMARASKFSAPAVSTWATTQMESYRAEASTPGRTATATMVI